MPSRNALRTYPAPIKVTARMSFVKWDIHVRLLASF
jgi:hypothetical protein